MTAQQAIHALTAAGYTQRGGPEQGFIGRLFINHTTIEFMVMPRHTRRIDQGTSKVTKIRTVEQLESVL